MANSDFDTAIIGAGVVGLAIASRLSERGSSIVVLEKNQKYGMETSSRNSEVIHAGIYYEAGSLKATLCVEGREELYSICSAHSIPHLKIGKIIIASTEGELSKLEGIRQNAAKNDVTLEMLSLEETKKLEPNISTLGSLFSRETGIISAHGLMDYFFHNAEGHGAIIQHNCTVSGIERTSQGYLLSIDEPSGKSTLTAEKVINAAGLFADKIAERVGIDVDAAGYRLHLCKGSYFSVTTAKRKLLSRLVYPVPTKDSLGVHAVLDLGGRIRFGPDVEYLKGSAIDYSVSESKRAEFLKSIKRILPEVTDEDISPDMSGIRPKLQKEGEPPRDFVIVHEKERGLEGFINLIGIDSPGLTSSPAIARYVERLLY